jgi:hypothetical protein
MDDKNSLEYLLHALLARANMTERLLKQVFIVF